MNRSIAMTPERGRGAAAWKLALPALLLVGAIGGGCSKGKSAAGGFAMPPTPVETALVEPGPVEDLFKAIGTLDAGEAITVVAEIEGTISSIPFREGEPIAKGGLIAQLDDSQLRAELERAEARRNQSRTAYERVKWVVDQGAGAPQDLDDSAGDLKMAQAELDLARARLDKTRITAPWGGILGARRLSPGAFARAGDAITTLAQLDQMRVIFFAPERFLPKLVRGAVVTVSTTAFPGESITGKVDVVEPVLDENTRSARVVARIPNPGTKLRAGMSADVSAVLSRRDNALMVPNEAIFVEGNQALLFVVKPDSSVARTPVTLGTRLDTTVEVLTGIEAGARVVRSGHQKLYEGAKVNPVTSNPS